MPTTPSLGSPGTTGPTRLRWNWRWCPRAGRRDCCSTTAARTGLRSAIIHLAVGSRLPPIHSGDGWVRSRSPKAERPSPFFSHLLNFFDAGRTHHRTVRREFVSDIRISPSAVAVCRHRNRAESRRSATTASSTRPDLTRRTWSRRRCSTAIRARTPTGRHVGYPYTLGSSPMGTYLRPPLNKVSEYRDPGRVNINTVQDPVVWQGVLNGVVLSPAHHHGDRQRMLPRTVMTRRATAVRHGPTGCQRSAVPTNHAQLFHQSLPLVCRGGVDEFDLWAERRRLSPMPTRSASSRTRYAISTPRCCDRH